MRALLRQPQFLLDLLVSGVLPWLIYRQLEPMYGEVTALWCSALPPAVLACIELMVVRRVDLISGLALAGIGVSLIIDMVSGSARLILVRESLVTGVLGAIGLLTLLGPKPAFQLLAEAALSKQHATGVPVDMRILSTPSFHRMYRVLTFAWALALVVEAAIRLLLLRAMEPGGFLVVSPFIQYGILGGLFMWTAWYGRRLKRGLQGNAAHDATA